MKTDRNILLITREGSRAGEEILPLSFTASSALKLYEFLIERYEIIYHQRVHVYRHYNRNKLEELVNNGPEIPSYEVFRKKINLTSTFRYYLEQKTGSRFYLFEQGNRHTGDHIVVQRIPMVC